MGEIYRNASRVLAWLGKEDARSAIAQLENFSHNHDLYIEDMTRLRFEPIARIWDAKAMHRFFDRAWFLRIWIVQEFALARDIQFFAGNDTLCYIHFARGFIVI